MKYLAVLLLILLLVAPTLGITPLEADSMEAKVTIRNSVIFEDVGQSYYVDEATGRLTWYPRDGFLQDVSDMTYTPEAEFSNDAFLFTWMTPGEEEEGTEFTGSVITRNAVVPIRKKIPYPIREIPEEVAIYLGEEAIIDQNGGIEELAEELAYGKDDVYEVVFALADWTTTNVEYSLDSLGEPAIQKSSEVLESRWGKCDELTALFISLNRALGIPARFVAGYSYTNSPLLANEWGGHGWAEVWFPDVGWIPFDVTYGEYGYLDAGHIALKVAPDAKETSIDYTARGRDFQLQTESLDISVIPGKMTSRYDPLIEIELSAPEAHVGFGSTVLILATVRNQRSYYVSTRLDLAPTSNTDMLSNNYENVLLKPFEQKIVPFLVKIDNNLDPKYKYEFPFTLSSKLGETATISIDVQSTGEIFDESAFSETLAGEDSEREGPGFTVHCEQDASVYTGEDAHHTCTVRDASPDALSVCLEDNGCDIFQVSDNKFVMNTKKNSPGVFTDVYTTVYKGETTEFYVTTRALAKTELKVTLEAPMEAEPSDLVTVESFIEHEGALPRDITITLSVHNTELVDELEDLSRPARETFHLPGMVLRPGENDITLTISYIDELGTESTEKFVTTVELVNVEWLDHLAFWSDDAWNWLASWF